MGRKNITTYYLEMTSRPAERPARPAPAGFEIRRVGIPCAELNRFLYATVGGDWYWTDKLSWTYAQWLEYVSRPELTTWVGWQDGTPAGYFELEHLPATGVELAYFGLLPQFIGKGLGVPLLEAAIDRAWAMGPSRVWVHTCTLDSDRALGNYQARGFRLYKQEDEEKDLPELSPGPWPGAHPQRQPR